MQYKLKRRYTVRDKIHNSWQPSKPLTTSRARYAVFIAAKSTMTRGCLMSSRFYVVSLIKLSSYEEYLPTYIIF